MISALFYKLIIDPLLSNIQNRACKTIPGGSKIIDIACGIGTLAIKNSKRGSAVTGIDLSSESIRYAKRRALRAGINKLHFFEMDARDLSAFKENEFEYSTISMAVHQFPSQTGKEILKEMARISKSIVIIDYNHPMPINFSGMVVRIIEAMAGKEHHRNFKAYLEMGGILNIAEGLGINAEVKFGGRKKVFTIVHFKAA